MSEEKNLQTENVSAPEVPAKKEPEEKKRRVIITQEMILNECRGVVENTFADSVIQEAAAIYGYDSQRLQEGKSLLENTVSYYEGYKNKLADQILKRKEFTEKWHLARKTYTRIIKSARLALDGNEELQDRVGVKFIKAAPFGVGVARAKLFYNNVEQMPDIMASLAKYNITPQDILDGKQQVLDAETADSQHRIALADTQQAAALKGLEFKKLRTWIADYRKVMRVALKSNGQLLEKLGVRVPSPKA